MKTRSFLRLATLGCFGAMFLTTIADAQPPGGGRERGAGRPQRGQNGGPGGPGGGFGQRPGGGGFGQRGPGGGGFSVDRAMLLRSDDVRDELEIDEAQAATIDAALEAFREEAGGGRPSFDREAFQQMSDEERTAFFEKMRSDAAERSRKRDDVLAALLEPEQTERIDQIVFQVNSRGGLIATLKSDATKKKLSITEEQVAKLDGIEEAARADRDKQREEMRAAFQNGGGGNIDFAALQKASEEARKKLDEQVMSVLSDQQKQDLASLKGKPFELDMRALFGRGRGPGGGPPGGDRGRGGRDGGRGGDGGRGRGGERQRPTIDDAI